MSIKFKNGLPVKFEGYESPNALDVITFFDDFLTTSISDTNDAATWDKTLTGSGTAALLDATDADHDAMGGCVVLTPHTTNTDVASIIAHGEAFELVVGSELYFETRFSPTDVSAVGCFIGLSGTDANANAGLVNGVGIQQTASAFNIISDDTSGDVQTDALTVAAPADGVWYNFAFKWDGVSKIDFYFSTADNELEWVHSLSTATTADLVPVNLSLTPTVEAVALTGCSGDAIWVDYVLCQMTRRRA